VLGGRILRTSSGYAVILVCAFAFSGGCAGSARRPCPSQSWEGKCKLHALTKIEEREMPMPYVTYEAIYVPQPNEEYPQFTPSELHLRFGTPAAHELPMVDHLKQQQEVACHAAIAKESCLPEQVTADVVPFDADHAPPAAAPSIVGCAAIDSASEQDRLARTRTEGSKIEERFTFGEGSAALSRDATSSARDIAKRMVDEPNLECVGVVGQTAPGEPLSLAEARARAVKQLLVSLGVDSRRLLTIAANAHVAGAASKTQPAIEPETRRVSLRVLLETSAKSAP
jgi:outer membrane protein OmpA-like peptidoglycan-associated protein